MIDRCKPLFEMSFSLRDYENKIILPLMMKAFKHFIKYKLTDKFFADKIDMRIYSHCIKYKEHWAKEIKTIMPSLFKIIKKASIKNKNSSKEEAYLSILENTVIMLTSDDQAIYAVRDATSEHKKKEDIRRKIDSFFIENDASDMKFILEVYNFFKEIKPIKNLMVVEDSEVQEKLKKVFTTIDTIHE
jgi:hypothetical protein